MQDSHNYLEVHESEIAFNYSDHCTSVGPLKTESAVGEIPGRYYQHHFTIAGLP